MSRVNKFKDLQNHAWLKREFGRLSSAEIEECISFIKAREHLNKNEFMMQINRWKLDCPDKRTKHHTDMWALILQSV